VSKVRDMSYMFSSAESFNQNISRWNTRNVVNMISMFDGASSFNQPIGIWSTSRVQRMRDIFKDASSFDQDLSRWSVGNVRDYKDVDFSGCPIRDEYLPEFIPSGSPKARKFKYR
jgi:surface protein